MINDERPNRRAAFIVHRSGWGAAIRDVAQAAERLGFDSAWVMDHVVIPDVPETRQFTTRVFDPLVTLSYLAACTERVRLGTTVLSVPYRSPLENVVVEPKPVQQPHPPLWIGGSTPPALRRAARLAALWHPTTRPPESIARRAAVLGQAALTVGRDPATIGFVTRAVLKLLPASDRATSRHSLIGTSDEVAAAIRAYRAAGVTGFVLDAFYGDPAVEDATPAEVLATLETFAREIMPGLAE